LNLKKITPIASSKHAVGLDELYDWFTKKKSNKGLVLDINALKLGFIFGKKDSYAGIVKLKSEYPIEGEAEIVFKRQIGFETDILEADLLYAQNKAKPIDFSNMNDPIKKLIQINKQSFTTFQQYYKELSNTTNMYLEFSK